MPWKLLDGGMIPTLDTPSIAGMPKHLVTKRETPTPPPGMCYFCATLPAPVLLGSSGLGTPGGGQPALVRAAGLSDPGSDPRLGVGEMLPRSAMGPFWFHTESQKESPHFGFSGGFLVQVIVHG